MDKNFIFGCLPLAKKWVFVGLKYSIYENSSKRALGVTNYAGRSSQVEYDFKKSISQAVDTFRLPLADLFLRQKKVMDILVQSAFSEVGLTQKLVLLLIHERNLEAHEYIAKV